jgi:hypothetical protein
LLQKWAKQNGIINQAKCDVNSLWSPQDRSQDAALNGAAGIPPTPSS